MPPDDIPTWIFQYHHLMAPVTALSGHGQLLRRQILRSDGLSNLERDMLLGTLATMMSSVQTLRDHVDAIPENNEPVP
jgi:hypothetical protein